MRETKKMPEAEVRDIAAHGRPIVDLSALDRVDLFRAAIRMTETPNPDISIIV